MRTAFVFVLLAVAEAACSSGGPMNPKTANGDLTALPNTFVQQVKSEWKDSSLEPRSTAACSGTTGGTAAAAPDADRAFVAGDFDGDGGKDVAAPVKRGDGLHVVAGLQHTYEYSLVDVTDKADASADRLTVRARGTRYTVPGSEVDYYFGHDTIVLAPCGGTPTAYLWTGDSFEPQPLAK